MAYEFETARLSVRRMGPQDAGFLLAMLNDPGFLANIGDRGVRTIADAEANLHDRMFVSYARHGFGMLRVALRDRDEAIGLVGFVQREGLDGPDLGFAFLADRVGQGYGYEAASGLLATRLDLRPLLAIAASANAASIALLAKLGFAATGSIVLPGIDGESRLFRLA